MNTCFCMEMWMKRPMLRTRTVVATRKKTPTKYRQFIFWSEVRLWFTMTITCRNCSGRMIYIDGDIIQIYNEIQNDLQPQGRSPQICTVTNFREEFWISPLWCLFFCFSLTFGVYVMKKYIPELSYFFSQFSSHIYMSRVRTWQLTFSPNHMKWAFWINKITFFYQHIY